MDRKLIPKIDYKDLLNEDPLSLSFLEKGIKETGFFILYNTPIKKSDVEKVINNYRNFFLLPKEIKNLVSMAKTGSNRGWGDLYGEQVNPNYNADYKEIFDNGLELEKKDPLSKLSVYAKNNWPAEPENFSKIILSYYEDSIKLSKSILKSISKIIDRDQNYFDDKFQKPMALLRGNFYPERPKWAGEKDFGIASHTDYGCLTLLANDGTTGLEVLNLNNEWVPISFEPGEFVVNFGEMLQMWSNDQIKATPHRVKGSTSERISIPLFFNPSYYTDISPENSNTKITAGEYLTKRYQETYTHLQKKENLSEK